MPQSRKPTRIVLLEYMNSGFAEKVVSCKAHGLVTGVATLNGNVYVTDPRSKGLVPVFPSNMRKFEK